jgi:putative permease
MSESPKPQNTAQTEVAPTPLGAAARTGLTSDDLQRVLIRVILMAAGLFVIHELAAPLTTLLLFFLLVFILAAVLNPVVSRLQRWRIPRPLGALSLVLLFLAAVALLGWLVLPPLLEELAQFFTRLSRNQDWLTTSYQQLLRRYPQLAQHIPAPAVLSQQLVQTLTPVLGRVGRHTINAAAGLLSLLLLLVLVIFTLSRPAPLIAGLLSAVPEHHRGRAVSALRRILHELKTWATSALIMGAIVGAMVGIGLRLLGVPQALLFGVIAGAGEVVPNIGPLLSAVPPILMALTIHPLLALWVLLLFIAVHQLEGNLIVPFVMGRSLHLHPVSVIFTILTMGTLFGLLGAILAVPVCAIVKICWEEFYLIPACIDTETLQAVAHDIASDLPPPASAPSGRR